jgi:hypothetical protein
VFTDPVLQRVRKLPQLYSAAAQFVFEQGLNRDHEFLPRVGRARCPTIQCEKSTESGTDRRGLSTRIYRSLTSRLRPKLLVAHVSCDFELRLGAHRSSPPEPTRLDEVSLDRQIAVRAKRRLVCHCATMTSPGLLSTARTHRGLIHDPFGSHQMTTGATQRRPRVRNRWEPHQFTDRRHSATVCAVPARGINKSDGLAEKATCCEGRFRRKKLSIPMFRVLCIWRSVSFGPCLNPEERYASVCLARRGSRRWRS